MGDLFPRINNPILAPNHVGLGRLLVKDCGILALHEHDVGTIKVFYDIDRAEEEGHFGPAPVIWGEREMHFALELLASGLDLEGKAWEDHVYSPTMWDDDDGKRRDKGASKSQVAGLTLLREMKRNPSQMASHFAAQPAISKAKAAKLGPAGSPNTEGVMKATVDAIKDYTLERSRVAAKKQRIDPVATDACPPIGDRRHQREAHEVRQEEGQQARKEGAGEGGG
jgi:hypothetical protein